MNESKPSAPETSINRRGFLMTTSTALLGSTLLGRAVAAEKLPAVHVGANETLKIALIGCGGRGSGAADQALSTEGPVKLVAMADANPQKLKKSLENLKSKHGDRVDVPEDRQFVGFDAYKKAIQLADVVILATPPGFRPIHFEEAVNANKHIFTEKPVAVDGPGVRKFLAAAQLSKEKGLKVGVGLQRHHQAGYIDTIQRLHDGAIGDIVSMRCYWNGNRPWQHPRRPGMTEMEFQMDNWYYFTWLCGDHIVEQHIHNLDVINWVKQAHPIRATGMGGCQTARNSDCGEIFDHHAVQFEYADGSRLYSECRHILHCWDSVSEHVQGTKGKADVSGYKISGAKKWQHTGKELKSPYQVEHDDLFAAIRKNLPYNEAEYGAHSTMTAIMGRMATYSGKLIERDAALNSTVSLAPDVYAWDAKPKPEVGADGLYPMPIPGDPKWQSKIV